MAISMIDMTVIVVVILSALISLWRGFARELLSLLNWAAAVTLSVYFGESVAAMMPASLGPDSVRSIAGFAAIFIGTLLLGAIINAFVNMLIARIGLGGTDRMLGMLFGVMRGAAVVTLVVLLAGLTALPKNPIWQSSQSLPYFQKMAEQVITYLPPELASQFNFQ